MKIGVREEYVMIKDDKIIRNASRASRREPRNSRNK